MILEAAGVALVLTRMVATWANLVFSLSVNVSRAFLGVLSLWERTSLRLENLAACQLIGGPTLQFSKAKAGKSHRLQLAFM